MIGLVGIVALVGLAWAMSSEKRRIKWRVVIAGLVLQFILAVIILRVPGVREVFDAIAQLVNGVIVRADAGIEFVFGPKLGDPNGPAGFVFAFRALPVIIFFASLMGILYYLGLMQRVIAAFAWMLRKALRVTGAEALAMAANVFVGQTEAPLTVKPLLDKMTRAQLMTLMVGGFATIAGSVLAVYVTQLGGQNDAARVMYAKHLIVASVISAPAAFVMARLIVPETEDPPPEDMRALLHQGRSGFTNVLDAAAGGATDGLRLALNVGAMLIAFVALIALVNWPLESLSMWEPVANWRESAGVPVINLERLLGWLFAPLAWLMGVPWKEAPLVGTLMGEKLVATEFVAYMHLGRLVAGEEPGISERSAVISSYALCGFANFASIAIQIGGLTALAPSRRKEFAELAMKAMFGGALASWTTACVASVIL